ncbi:lipopolysaccharide biosynthesis protein [Vulcaniibacterium tengchongense]|nr:lipopolysaccharide biosynthesis protein [Vulcaniibacterium tengchongense]
MFVFACAGALGTWLARGYALRRQLIDEPGERRSHSVATPRGGGIAIVAALVAAAAWLAWRRPQDAPLLGAFAVGLLLVGGIGLLDDHRPLSPWLRLAVQAMAAALYAGVAGAASGSLWLAALAFVAAMVLVNVWNFMDGINGLAASQAALAAAAFAYAAGGAWAWLGAALVAACLGFLPFNFPSARIFLGDVGSGALGFALAGLLVAATPRNGAVLGAAWLALPVSAFLIDAGLTLLGRLVRGERWWTPHTRHAYQAWARRRGHSRVTLAYAGFTAVAAILALCAASLREPVFIACIVLAWYTCGALLWRRLRRSA